LREEDIQAGGQAQAGVAAASLVDRWRLTAATATWRRLTQQRCRPPARRLPPVAPPQGRERHAVRL
jgi:hypothetical protein